jgi:hypothetical protein
MSKKGTLITMIITTCCVIAAFAWAESPSGSYFEVFLWMYRGITLAWVIVGIVAVVAVVKIISAVCKVLIRYKDVA